MIDLDSEDGVRSAFKTVAGWYGLVLRHPISELDQWFWRTVRAYESDPDAVDAAGGELSGEWLSVWRASADAAYFGVLALVPCGALAFLFRPTPPRAFFLLAAATFAAVPLLLYGDVRYKVPLAPWLIGLAAVAGVAAFEAVRGRPPVEHAVGATGDPQSPGAG